jgi:bifunctional pyridoxal-dependent enzyme with beta-cystathionase and maltose regulon repressor activities
MHIAERMSRLGTETAFEVLVKARALEAQGRNIVHLEIGEPDFDTPQNIIDAAKTALDKGFTHYGPAAGYPEVLLLQSILTKHVVIIFIKQTRWSLHPAQSLLFFMHCWQL